MRQPTGTPSIARAAFGLTSCSRARSRRWWAGERAGAATPIVLLYQPYLLRVHGERYATYAARVGHVVPASADCGPRA